jgi:hypothetical protein
LFVLGSSQLIHHETLPSECEYSSSNSSVPAEGSKEQYEDFLEDGFKDFD